MDTVKLYEKTENGYAQKFEAKKIVEDGRTEYIIDMKFEQPSEDEMERIYKREMEKLREVWYGKEFLI